ncbi:MAG: PLP-dependent transferase, partial [Deltaproteobacteria bacterium]|nr:PLP-dependent transferase [Deltaproteobacteria bacterium]
MKKETQCVHSGTYRDNSTRGVNTPIFTSSAFDYLNRQDTPYPRYFNTPNQDTVVKKLCALEGAEDGVVFSSGMAAISTTILSFAGAGDHVILLDDLYGGTHAFATDEFER